MFVGTSDMNINVTKPQFVSFFVPVGIGVVTQMFCAGLLMAITAIGFTSTENPPNEPPVAASPEPAVTAKPNTDAPRDPGNSDPSPNPPTTPSPEIPAPPGETPAEVQPLVTGKPLDDVRNKSRTLPIAGEGVPNEIALCLIRASDPAKVDLELLGGEFALPQELIVKVDRLSSDEKSCVWRVTQVSAVGLVRTQDVGEFLLKDQQFSFRWLKDADKGKLPFCRLKISADSDSEVCDLWSSVHSPALQVRFSKSNQTMDPFVARGVKLPPAELLQLDLTFEGWPKHEPTGDTLVLNETLEILFPEEDSDRNLLKILLTLKAEGGQLAVHAAFFTEVPEYREGSAKDGVKYKDVKKELSHQDFERLRKKMETESGKYQKELDRLSTRLNDLQNSPSATLAEIQRTEKQHSQAEELSDVFSAADAAMKQLSELIVDIEKKGLIHFQLTRPLGGVESDVVISSSVNAAAVEAGRVP